MCRLTASSRRAAPSVSWSVFWRLPGARPVLAAPSHQAADGQCVVLGSGGRAVPATDAKYPRGLAPPGVPAPDRAVPQGPARPGHAAFLRVQLRDALSRPLDGPADGQRAHGGVQRVLTAGRRGAMLSTRAYGPGP